MQTASTWGESVPPKCHRVSSMKLACGFASATQVARAKFGPLEDDLGLLTAVTNKDLLEAADFGSRRFLKRLVTMPIGIQKSFRGNFVH